MFFYICTGIGILCSGLYVFSPRILYTGIANTSIFIIRQMLWLKNIKQKLLNEKTKLVYKNKLQMENMTIREYDYKIIDNIKNYTHTYTLKYITHHGDENTEYDVEHESDMNITLHVDGKLKKFEDIELLNKKLNQILHCSFYLENDPDTIFDLTNDLRHFVLHFDCDKTSFWKFIEYAINNHDLHLFVQNVDECGINIIKNDDSFTDIKIKLNNSKHMTFKELFEDF